MSYFKQIYRQFFASSLLKGSLIMFFGSILVGFLNYLFYPVMARFLPKTDYASLIAVVSLVNFISVPTISLNTVVTKFTSEYRAKDEENKIKSLFLRLSKFVLIGSIIAGVLITILSNQLLSFLKIDSSHAPIYLALLLVINLMITIPYGILQGLLKFHYFVLGNTFAALGRLLLGPTLVLVGWGLDGSLMGILIGLLAAYVVTLAPILSYLKRGSQNAKAAIREVLIYTLPTTLAILGITAFITTDILLVNHFSPKELAGEYSLGSVLGRIIIFTALPITNVMFPIVSQRFASGKNYLSVFNLSFLLIGLVGLGVTLIYFFVPQLVLLPLGKGEYIELEGLLGFFGIFAALQALATFLTYFNLSIKRTWVWLAVLLAAFFQGMGIFYFHESLVQILNVNILSLLILVSFLVVSFYLTNKQK